MESHLLKVLFSQLEHHDQDVDIVQVPSSQFLSNINDRNRGNLVVNKFATNFLSVICHTIHLTISPIKNVGMQGSNFGNKTSYAKKIQMQQAENRQHWLKKSLGFVKCFSEFAKGIYETCDHAFFNLANIIVVFSIVQFILFLHFARNNQRRNVENFRIPGRVKLFFFPQCDLMGHPILNVKLRSKTTLHHKN